MTDVDTVTTYLTKISQVRYALNGFTAKWHTFVQGIVARENLPNWTRLWDDFVQEETWEGTFQNGTRSSE